MEPPTWTGDDNGEGRPGGYTDMVDAELSTVDDMYSLCCTYCRDRVLRRSSACYLEIFLVWHESATTTPRSPVARGHFGARLSPVDFCGDGGRQWVAASGGPTLMHSYICCLVFSGYKRASWKRFEK